MENNQKIEYKPLFILRDFIAYQILILYVVLQIGNFLLELDNDFIARYIPVALVGLIASFFILKSLIKKCKKSEEESVKKMLFLGPILVSIILFLYGMSSVSSNMPKAKADVQTELQFYVNLQTSIYGEDIEDEIWEEVDKELEKIEKESRKKWCIVSIIFFVTSGFVTFISTKNLNKWLIDEEIVMEEKENLVKNDLSNIEPSEDDVTLNNIKWNL